MCLTAKENLTIILHIYFDITLLARIIFLRTIIHLSLEVLVSVHHDALELPFLPRTVSTWGTLKMPVLSALRASTASGLRTVLKNAKGPPHLIVPGKIFGDS